MEKKMFNGIEVAQMQGMVDAVKKQPQMAQAKMYAKTEWKSGFNNEASIKDFEMGGATKQQAEKAHSLLRETTA